MPRSRRRRLATEHRTMQTYTCPTCGASLSTAVQLSELPTCSHGGRARTPIEMKETTNGGLSVVRDAMPDQEHRARSGRRVHLLGLPGGVEAAAELAQDGGRVARSVSSSGGRVR